MNKKISFEIEGMACAVCASVCEKALKDLKGVSDVSVNLASKKAALEYEDKIISIDNIYQAVRNCGFTPIENKDSDDGEFRKLKQLRRIKLRLFIAIVFTLPVLYLSMGSMLGLPPLINPDTYPVAFTLTLLAFTLAVMGAGYKFYTTGYKNLFKLRPNMDSLVALGTSAAFIFSLVQSFSILFLQDYNAVGSLFFESVAVIISLVMLGKFLELRSVGKTGEAVKKLLDMSPKYTVVCVEDHENTISVNDVKKGDILLARPGDAIAVDGVAVNGGSYVDESMLTGESGSIWKENGKAVYAGTVNQSGMLYYRAEKVGSETVLSKIIAIVEEAQNSKAPVSRMADKVAAVFVPTVGAVALLSFFIWWIIRGDISFAVNVLVSVLVIACPCALGLATPAAIITGTGKGAQLGILFKSAEGLEKLSQVNEILFDKTGTLTEGKPRVTDIYAAEGFTLMKILSCCASVEQGSKHPLAQAVIREAEERNIDFYKISEFTSYSGRGVSAVVDGKTVKCGSPSFFENNTEILKEAERFSEAGKTVIAISIEERFAGIIALSDTLKEDAKTVVGILQDMNIETVMLSGDSRRAANRIAEECGIKSVIAEVLPDGKAAIVEERKQKHKLAMVGDGINDAPALSAADCGIAVGGGTDVAIESADVVLTGKSLKGVADAVILSKKVMRNIKQNLFWAFIYNIIGIPVAAGVLFPIYGILLNPMLAALAMSFSSVSVVLNALRLNLFKSRFTE